MNCERNSGTLAMYLDGQLPSDQEARLQEHIGQCPDCAAEIAELVSLKQNLRTAARNRFVPSTEFRRKISQQIARPKRSRWLTQFVPALVTLCILMAAVIVGQEYSRRTAAFSEVADLHIGTLASANPVDVLSTDRHTVKPWFQGRIPFSFNIPELNGTGFDLIGGREVFLHQSPGAQLLVGLRQHKISVLIFQESSEIAKALPAHVDGERRNSFNVETWQKQGLRFLIIGDTDASELHKLALALQAVNG